MLERFQTCLLQKYVDDIFVLFNKPEHAIFFEYINKKYKNMNLETEINGSLSFLDVKISWENNKFVTSGFRKKRLVGWTLISSVLFRLSTSLVWYTPYWIVVLIHLQTFWNSTMKLITFVEKCISKKVYWKMHSKIC